MHITQVVYYMVYHKEACTTARERKRVEDTDRRRDEQT